MGVKRYKLYGLDKEPMIEDIMNSVVYQKKLPKTFYKDIREIVSLARKFNDKVVKPHYKEIDLKVAKDPDYLPWEFIKEAAKWGFFSMWIPKIFGGKNKNFLTIYPFLEEIASVCTGLANVIGVHYLGFATMSAGWNLRLMNKISREVVKSEKKGKPKLISLAITEPSAGTDVEEVMLLEKARIGTIAKRTEGGYILNGRKVFISNGHVSTYHMVIAYEDRKHPEETMVMLAVKNGMEGFSFGRKERKMGQKACVASELIFDNCFVPDELVCVDNRQIKKYKKPIKEIYRIMIDFVVGASRVGVAAFATGAARGAYETALEYAKQTQIVNKQWVQLILADMYKNVNAARTTYIEGAFSNLLYGMYKVLYRKSIYYMTKLYPRWLMNIFVSPFINMSFATHIIRKIYYDWYTVDEAQITSGWGSLVKFLSSDAAIENASLAMDIMGMDGTRWDIGAEKYYRDAKLLQIYEGTNQLNRLNLFKNLIAKDDENITYFN